MTFDGDPARIVLAVGLVLLFVGALVSTWRRADEAEREDGIDL